MFFSIKLSETFIFSFQLRTNSIIRTRKDGSSITSCGKIIFDGIENRHIFDLRTITEKLTKRKKH